MRIQYENPIELKEQIKKLEADYEILSNTSSDDPWFDADELEKLKRKIAELKIRYDVALAEFYLMSMEN